MKRSCLLSVAVIFSAVVALGQDCKLEEIAALANLKDAVHRVTKERMYTGFDDKTFSRSGDLAAVAIVKTIPDGEMTSPDTLNEILHIVRTAFACPSRCIAAPSYRQPNVTLLLLEHLQNAPGGRMQAAIDETRKYVLQQTHDGE